MVAGEYALFYVSFDLLQGQMHSSFALRLLVVFQPVEHLRFVYSLIFVSVAMVGRGFHLAPCVA